VMGAGLPGQCDRLRRAAAADAPSVPRGTRHMYGENARRRPHRPGYRPSYGPGRPRKGQRKRQESHPTTTRRGFLFLCSVRYRKAVLAVHDPLRTVAPAAPTSSPLRRRVQRPEARRDRQQGHES
jgi:hypothetical protein